MKYQYKIYYWYHLLQQFYMKDDWHEELSLNLLSQTWILDIFMQVWNFLIELYSFIITNMLLKSNSMRVVGYIQQSSSIGFIFRQRRKCFTRMFCWGWGITHYFPLHSASKPLQFIQFTVYLCCPSALIVHGWIQRECNLDDMGPC